MGTVQGFTSAYPESCLIWIDAHADINTLPNSPSGNMHGMPVSFNLPELFRDNLTNDNLDMSWFSPRLNPRRMAFIGLRSVDPEERVILDTLNIPNFSMREVEEFGIREVNEKQYVNTTLMQIITKHATSLGRAQILKNIYSHGKKVTEIVLQ